MRLQGRAALGFFPTPDRVVKAVAKLLDPGNQTVSIVDAGAGKGDALVLLREELLKQSKLSTIRLYGVELDKNRAEEADAKFQASGGYCLWSGVEESGNVNKASVLYYNPPYDTVRGEGRLEEIMLQHVEGWLGKDGLMIAVLPRQALIEDDYATTLARYIDSKYTVVAYQFPTPEYEVYKQFVLFCTKNREESRYGSYGMPHWLENFNILKDNHRPQFTLKPFASFGLKRDKMSVDVMKYAIDRSGASGFLLQEASAHASKIEQPLLPLKEGHLALALAGGLCDGVVHSAQGRFLLKGSLASDFLQVSERDKVDGNGEVTHRIATFRTTYKMLVRCLLEDGTLEDYNSHDDQASEAELLDKDKEPEEEEEGGEIQCQSSDTRTQNRLRRTARRAGRGS